MRNKLSFSLQEVFFFLILIALSVAFYNIFLPFIGDSFLALILVILFKRPFRWFRKKFNGNTKKAAGLTTIMVFFTIVIPLMFIGFIVANEAGENYTKIKNQWPAIKEQLTEETIKARFADVPLLGEHINKMKFSDFEDKLDELVSTATEWAVVILEKTFTGLTYTLIHVFILLFLLYFMFADGDKLLERLQYLIPLKDEDEKELMDNIEKVTDAIVINSFMLGIIEGTYGGILFALLGIPSPVFWGIIMAGLSIIPLVGTNSIMVPAFLIHLLLGDYTTAFILLGAGTGVILINQNLVRPRLDANRSGMHTAIALIASLGGLLWLGVIGFLAGPLLTGLFILIWDQYGKKYKDNLEEMNKGTEEKSPTS
ncbi:MAG: AI-2E family transporter [Bacteroidales bacterium]|nr:AI-2E family transporter [Bacteroidales bacterium]